MSILAAAASASVLQKVFVTTALAFVAGLAVLIATATGLFRLRLPASPPRLLSDERNLWRLLLVMGAGLLIFFLVQAAYGERVRERTQPRGPATAPAKIAEEDLRPADWAFLSTIPFILGFLALLAGDYLFLGGRAAIRTLGLRGPTAGFALLGLVGIVVAAPLLEAVSVVTEQVYEYLHVAHPQEHELLKIMGDSHDRGIRVLLITAAVLLAPLFEELLFRGHLQTFLREAFIGRHRESDYGNPAPGTKRTWLAIVVASAVFTCVHPPWMWPPIFFLALCLGYAYERTGSLWTSIAMHASFNAISTAFYLGFVR